MPPADATPRAEPAPASPAPDLDALATPPRREYTLHADVAMDRGAPPAPSARGGGTMPDEMTTDPRWCPVHGATRVQRSAAMPTSDQSTAAPLSWWECP
ncbi:MAG TPA: hypothetical protein VFS44_02365, partial [Gemmatimonadaceae bacterium]|nr:hypothetical protein [Gemmatimonadaceae bacterium]